MKPIYLNKNSKTEAASFTLHHFKGEQHYGNLHFHSEVELTYVVESQGTLVVGNSIHQFNEGDFIMIGANIPHVWKSENTNTSKTVAQSYGIHFLRNFMGDAFYNLPEMQSLVQLLDRSVYGIRFHSDTSKAIYELLNDLFNNTSTSRRLILLLDLLECLANTSSYELLSSIPYDISHIHSDFGRMQAIYEYTIKHFSQPISLIEISGIANMNVSAFCRYFNAKTGKTYGDFLNEVRIHYVCHQLKLNQLSITQLCFDCGYQHVATFNRQFKAVMGMTPMEYRKNILKL